MPDQQSERSCDPADLDTLHSAFDSGMVAAAAAERRFNAFESLAVFALGAAMMTLAYRGQVGPVGSDSGVPGHDSFYHIKMASMLPSVGIIREFPWLHFTYFQASGPGFISHHFGFHVLLAPFVHVSHWLTGDYLAGGRWATATFLGLVAMLFNLLLMAEGVRWRGLWLVLFFFLPVQFFSRHAFVRAISPSMAFMLLILLLMYWRRFRWAGVAVAGYTHLYLGGVLFAPVVVAAYAFCVVCGPSEQRKTLGSLIGWTCGGWLVGVLTYPYAGGTFEFLKVQVFGTGLSPDISVGREWNPYTDVWWFASLCGVVLSVWVISLCARLRLGPVLNAKELTAVLLNFLFLVLTFKARRFIEYWPVFCLLSAALLARPMLNRVAERADRVFLGLAQRRGRWLGALAIFASVSAVFGFWGLARALPESHALLRFWPLWAIPIIVLAALWVVRVRSATAILGGGGRSSAMGVMATVIVLTCTAVGLGSVPWNAIQRSNQCKYDLPEIRKMMAFLQDRSEPGDVIFTDDWDVFPVYFYHNDKSHYIVGLDPKFTHHRRPDLWERYVKVSRGQTPVDTSYIPAGEKGLDAKPESIHVRLEDIRTHFGARFVITDRDHKSLAVKLSRASHLAELIYPSTSYAEVRDKPFLVFRILKPGEAPTAAKQAESERPPDDLVYLSDITPSSVEQGWGDLAADRSVGGTAIRLGSRSFDRGLGTHAPSKLTYRMPDGFGVFRATVGVDRGSGGEGSVVVSVWLDDELAFQTSVLTRSSEPQTVCVPVGSARKLVLQADPTADGEQFDHVNWADARLERDARCVLGGD